MKKRCLGAVLLLAVAGLIILREGLPSLAEAAPVRPGAGIRPAAGALDGAAWRHYRNEPTHWRSMLVRP